MNNEVQENINNPFSNQKTTAELEIQSYNQRSRFEYAFGALIFGSLALSLQYSPQFGDAFYFLLFFAWLQFFISGFAAGYRIHRWVWYQRKRIQMYISNILNKTGRTAEIHYNDGEKILKDLSKYFQSQWLLYFMGLIYNCLFIILNYLIKSQRIKYFGILIELCIILIGVITFCLLFKNKSKFH